MRGAKFIFPITDGTVKLSGGDQDLRTFTLILDSPDRGEEQYHLQGESDGSSSIPLRDSSWYDGEARNDFWSISGDSIYRHHVEPRVKLYVLREESFLIPLKYVDVTRKYPYILRCDVVEKYWRLLECWWRSWIVRYVDWFHKIHCIEWKKHWMDIHAPGGDWRGNKRPQDPTEMWKHMSDASWRKDRETEARQCQKFAWFFLHWSCRWGIQAFYVECSCRLQRFPYTETCCAVGEHKTKYACIVEADETLRIRMEGSQSQNHEDRIAGKGMNPLTHHNPVRKFIPMPQAMKIPDAKAAVDKECEKFETIPAWDLTKVRNKSEVIDEARTNGRKVHFASLIDTCHLKNAELDAKHQKYKGRVVLRGEIVKDDSGSYAVFTEQGSSASQMTAAKVMDFISRLPGCAGPAADAVSAYTQVKMEDAPSLLKHSEVRMSRYLDTSTKTQMA